jgi:hypothetical protein
MIMHTGQNNQTNYLSFLAKPSLSWVKITRPAALWFGRKKFKNQAWLCSDEDTLRVLVSMMQDLLDID